MGGAREKLNLAHMMRGDGEHKVFSFVKISKYLQYLWDALLEQGQMTEVNNVPIVICQCHLKTKQIQPHKE